MIARRVALNRATAKDRRGIVHFPLTTELTSSRSHDKPCGAPTVCGTTRPRMAIGVAQHSGIDADWESCRLIGLAQPAMRLFALCRCRKPHGQTRAHLQPRN